MDNIIRQIAEILTDDPDVILETGEEGFDLGDLMPNKPRRQQPLVDIVYDSIKNNITAFKTKYLDPIIKVTLDRLENAIQQPDDVFELIDKAVGYAMMEYIKKGINVKVIEQARDKKLTEQDVAKIIDKLRTDTDIYKDYYSKYTQSKAYPARIPKPKED